MRNNRNAYLKKEKEKENALLILLLIFDFCLTGWCHNILRKLKICENGLSPEEVCISLFGVTIKCMYAVLQMAENVTFRKCIL